MKWREMRACLCVWVVQPSGWLRFSCWTSSCSFEDDRACVARRFLDELSGKLQLSSMKSWMRREEVRSPAGQPAAMQEKGWAALGPRSGFVKKPVCSSPEDGWRKSRVGRTVVEKDWAATLLLWEGTWRESEERGEWRGGEHALYWPGDLTGHGAQGDQW